jgi:hypothetical protein
MACRNANEALGYFSALVSIVGGGGGQVVLFVIPSLRSEMKSDIECGSQSATDAG